MISKFSDGYGFLFSEHREVSPDSYLYLRIIEIAFLRDKPSRNLGCR